jgi:hypothetical protein
MIDPGEMQYIKVIDDFFWSAYNQGVAIGSMDQSNTYGYQALD